MADFNVDLAAPQGAGANPVAPVSRGVNPLFGAVESVIESFGKLSEQSRKEKAEAVKQATVGEYARKLSAIEDAQISGQWDSRRVNAERRKLNAQFGASNPEYAKEFKEIRSLYMEGGGLGEAQEEEQLLQDERKAERSAMVNAGMYIPEWASPKLEEEMRAAFRTSRAADYEFKRTVDRNTELRAQKVEMRADEKVATEKRISSELGRLMTDHFTPASTFVTELVGRAKSMDPQRVQLEMGQYFANIDASISQIAKEDPSKAEPARLAFNNLRKMAEDAISGKVSKEQLANQLEEMKSRLQIAALSGSPQLQTGYVLNTLMPGIQISTVPEFESVASTLLKLSGSAGAFTTAPDLFRPDNMTVNQEVFEQLVRRGKAAKAGNVGEVERTEEQLGIAANNVTKTVGELNTSNLDGKTLTHAASYFASTEFKERRKKGAVDEEEAQKAKEVMQLTYERDVVRGVDQVMSMPFNRSGQLTNTNSQQTSDLVDIVFEGAGVKFKMKDVGYQSPVDRQDFRQIERRLSSAKQAIDQIVRIGAHLDNKEDYAAYFEENKHVLFPNYFPDPNKLKVGQTLKAKNGKMYKYLGGNFNDIENSYEEVSDGGER